MERNTSLPAAAPSKFIFSTGEIIIVSFLLIFLMTYSLPFLSPTWFLTAAIAFFLLFMIEEDAYEQTIDLILLFIVASLMLTIAAFHGREQFFIKQMIIGGCFFRFLLVLTSLFSTYRSISSAAISNKAWQEDPSSSFRERQIVGYLPVFAFVFILFLGFGEDFIPFIFSQAAFTVDTVKELVDFYPVLPYLGIVFWLSIESLLWWLEHKKRQQIIWAFGGGDVLFLGLFSGYLGLSALFSLFFLSLLARAMFSLAQFFIDHEIASTYLKS